MKQKSPRVSFKRALPKSHRSRLVNPALQMRCLYQALVLPVRSHLTKAVQKCQRLRFSNRMMRVTHLHGLYLNQVLILPMPLNPAKAVQSCLRLRSLDPVPILPETRMKAMPVLLRPYLNQVLLLPLHSNPAKAEQSCQRLWSLNPVPILPKTRM